MKKVFGKVITGMVLMLAPFQAFPQSTSKGLIATTIEPFKLPITYYKTTHLVFPEAIMGVDRGSEDILVQKAGGVENILQVKATKPHFKETNLTVITADGRLYPYIVSYSERPVSVIVHKLTNAELPKPQALFSAPAITDADLRNNAGLISGKKRTVWNLKDAAYGVQLRLTGIYIQNDVLYLQLRIENRSHIGYDIDQLRFFIRDQKEIKRTATQELELHPLYVKGSHPTVASLSEQVFVFALPKFPISDNKYLAVQLMEKNGGRHLELKVPNRTIIHAKPVPPN